jgi:hypothetical protein
VERRIDDARRTLRAAVERAEKAGARSISGRFVACWTQPRWREHQAPAAGSPAHVLGMRCDHTDFAGLAAETSKADPAKPGQRPVGARNSGA